MIEIDDPTVQQLADLLAVYDESLQTRDAAVPHGACLLDDGARRRFDAAASALQMLHRAKRVPVDAVYSPGDSIGRFKILRALGKGAFGEVYLAHDPGLDREIALKVLRRDANAGAQPVARFVQEAQTAAALRHPNIVPVYERGEVDGVSYIASAYCAGPTLAQWLTDQESLVDFRTAADVVAEICSAVQFAHERGVLHRDLKPANILLEPLADPETRTERRERFAFQPLLTDWGLAKPTHRNKVETQAGAILGTPGYIPPEQSPLAIATGPEGDVYALGVLLYVLLSGEEPNGEGPPSIARLRDDRPELPAELEEILGRALASDPRQRIQSAGALAEGLKAFVASAATGSDVARRARSKQKWLAVAVVALIGSSTIWASVGIRRAEQRRAHSNAPNQSRTIQSGLYSFQNMFRQNYLANADNWMSDRTDDQRHLWRVAPLKDGTVLLRNRNAKLYFTARPEGGIGVTDRPDQFARWAIDLEHNTIRNVAKDMYLVMPPPPDNITLEKLLRHEGSSWRIRRIAEGPI